MAKGKYADWLTPEGLLKIEGWARDGLTDEQIAQNMGIAYSTLRSWRDKFSAISAVLKKGRDGTKMPIRYKVDILEALKSKGYSTYKLRREKLLSEGVIQSLREGKTISLDNVSQICALLGCQPGDILEYVEDGDQK